MKQIHIGFLVCTVINHTLNGDEFTKYSAIVGPMLTKTYTLGEQYSEKPYQIIMGTYAFHFL